MAAFMRKSKFRHVFGQPLKRDQCYDNVRITKTSWDSTYCAVNPKYLAVITEAAGGGSFLVVPLGKTGRVERDCPLVAGHKAAVLDIVWCPHNDDVIASASEDCTVKVWQIPEGGLTTKNLTEPIVDLVAHQRKVGLIIWHPSANAVLLSAGTDGKIFIWNVGTGEILTEIDVVDKKTGHEIIPLSVSFNYNGSKFAGTFKDKTIKVFDARSGDCLKEGKGHDGSKPPQVVYLKDGRIFTTGFSRMSERQYAIWDENDLSKPLHMNEIDTSNGIMFPYYDPDTEMIFLAGKGDSLVRYYEVDKESPYVHYLALYQSSDGQRGFGWMPKRGLNVNNCEIARLYKLHNSGFCEVIPFTVPRKSELFQDDLYPDTASDIPAISAEEWFSGKDAPPVLISLKDGFVPSKKEAMKVVRRSNVLDKMPSKSAAAGQTASGNFEAAAAAALPPDFDAKKLMKDIESLKATVKEQDEKIVALEKRLQQLETPVTDEEEMVQQEEEED